MASVQAYDIAYRVRVLRGRTQAELMRLVASDLGVTLSSPEFNRILHGYYGGGDKTQKVLEPIYYIFTVFKGSELIPEYIVRAENLAHICSL